MANDIKMLSCPICNNSRWTNCGNGIHQCDICETYFDKDENILMTEQEYLQTCDTEQLAEILFRICERATWDYNVKIMVGEKKKELIVEWLKQPHTKGVNHVVHS